MIDNHFGDSHQCCFERCRARRNHRRLGNRERLLRLIAHIAHVRRPLTVGHIGIIDLLVDPRHCRYNKLIVRHSFRQLDHRRQIFADLAHATARQQSDDRSVVQIVAANKLLARNEGPLASLDIIDQRVATEGRLDTLRAEIFALEREDREQPIDIAAQLLHAPLLPRPDLRCDVVERAQPSLFRPLSHLHIEAGVVDQDQHVGRKVLDIGSALLELAPDRAQVAQHGHKPEERRFAVVLCESLLAALGRHQVATPETKLRLRIRLAQSRNQFRAVKIARRLACYEIVFHPLFVPLTLYLSVPFVVGYHCARRFVAIAILTHPQTPASGRGLAATSAAGCRVGYICFV